jgi:RNA polymerase sigma-70 factor (ECF subfamily)
MRESTASERHERELIAALRRGEERAFCSLIDAYNPALLRVAMAHVASRAVAEEVVQETWLGVLRGLDRFEGRSSLKTWIFRILTNVAKTRGARERRAVPFSALAAAEALEGPSVDPDRFYPPDHPHLAGHWSLGPTRWRTPEEELFCGERRDVVLSAIADLPPAQRTVIGLRDVEGWPPDEVCDTLGISGGNQRVLLHRARTKVRAALERYHAPVKPMLPAETAAALRAS